MEKTPRKAGSLRHYLLNDQCIAGKLKAKVILAEKANQLYRDTDYKDLITFEEDIARISLMVLLIVESAGSLAELGAFAANETIRKRLSVLVQSKYSDAESFVRFGPIKRIIDEDSERVGFYPWKIKADGVLIKASIASHVPRIKKFINDRLKKAPEHEMFYAHPDLQEFIVLYWIVFLSQAISLTELYDYGRTIFPALEQKDVKNKLFCMQMAGWVAKYQYENKTYWYTTDSKDPFAKYSFASGVKVVDTARRKSDVTQSIQKELSIPKHVRDFVAQNREF